VLDLIARDGIELGYAVASQTLGLMHRDVCVPNKVFGRVGISESRSDADAGRDEDFVAFDYDRSCKTREHTIRHFPHVDRVQNLLETYEELVAADASKGVLGPDRPFQSLGHLDQDCIACEVTERVVDGVEMVQAAGEHGDGRRKADAPLEGMFETVAKLHSVRKTCELVVERLMTNLLFGFIASLLDQLLRRNVPHQKADSFRDVVLSYNGSEATFEPSRPSWNVHTEVAGLRETGLEDVADDSDDVEPQLVT
jgi:hypothetical protein